MSDIDNRIRERAYHIWLREGQPLGRDGYHWEMARQEILREDAERTSTAAESALAVPLDMTSAREARRERDDSEEGALEQDLDAPRVAANAFGRKSSIFRRRK